MVADVRDEVGTHCVESGPLADVFHRHQHPAVGQQRGLHLDHSLRRPEQLHIDTARAALAGLLELTVDGLGHQHPGMTRAQQSARHGVAVHDVAIGVDQHHADGKAIEGCLSTCRLDPQPFDLGPRVGQVVQRRVASCLTTALEQTHVGSAQTWFSPVMMNCTRSPMFTAWSPMRS
jgi:hypothetical protein